MSTDKATISAANSSATEDSTAKVSNDEEAKDKPDSIDTGIITIR